MKLSRQLWILVLAGLLVDSTTVSAIPGWVKDAIESSKTAKPDKDAPGILLLNWSEVKISADGSSSQKVRRVVKVLRASGISSATVTLPINSVMSVKNLKGWRLEVGGEEHRLKKNNVIDIGYNVSGYYDDQFTRRAVFPEVKTGDVIAFEYKHETKKGVDYFTGNN